jgi:hypothetical protein
LTAAVIRIDEMNGTPILDASFANGAERYLGELKAEQAELQQAQ